MKRGKTELDQTLIHYGCNAPDHATANVARSGLTIHNGKWAYCPAGDMVAEHRWTETGGRPILEIRARIDGSLESCLSVAEALYAELVDAVGLTSFRLELARVGAPLVIDLGDPWPAPRSAQLEIALSDEFGSLGRVLIADSRRRDYHRLERGISMQIAARHAPTLRRLTVGAMR